jgi:inositol hexakisphosphate/diphosphoinositol-pentakisphosphate kinase
VVIRVKLPKSFLAVNLSETHTFHKKEDPVELPQSMPPIAAAQAGIQENLKNVEVSPKDPSSEGAPEATDPGCSA